MIEKPVVKALDQFEVGLSIDPPEVETDIVRALSFRLGIVRITLAAINAGKVPPAELDASKKFIAVCQNRAELTARHHAAQNGVPHAAKLVLHFGKQHIARLGETELMQRHVASPYQTLDYLEQQNDGNDNR